LREPNKIIATAHNFVWEGDLYTMPRWQVGAVRVLRLTHVVGRDLAQGQLSLRAMSLVYTTLLSLVPLLAISFSVLKGMRSFRPCLRSRIRAWSRKSVCPSTTQGNSMLFVHGTNMIWCRRHSMY